jgi:hypothetical protein
VANPFFQLVSTCYERASLIVTGNKPFGRCGGFSRSEDTVCQAPYSAGSSRHGTTVRCRKIALQSPGGDPGPPQAG